MNVRANRETIAGNGGCSPRIDAFSNACKKLTNVDKGSIDSVIRMKSIDSYQ